jgi:hypothetical protein
MVVSDWDIWNKTLLSLMVYFHFKLKKCLNVATTFMFQYVINVKSLVFTMFKNLNQEKRHITSHVKTKHVEIKQIFH